MVEGGANETKRGRPWEFVAVVHGFYGNDNDTNNANANAALSFEAAWQNPSKSLRIRNSIGDREAERLAEDLNGAQ